MLVFSGLGRAPNISTQNTTVKCAVVDPNGVCIQESDARPPTVSGGGGYLPVYRPRLPAWTQPPMRNPPRPFPPRPMPPMPLPPNQQPPPEGLPPQPELQPGTQITNQDEPTVYLQPTIPFGKIGLVIIGLLAASAGVAVGIARSRAKTA